MAARGLWNMAHKAGRASRDAEVAELTRLLAESRANTGDREARLVEAEAVIQAVRDFADWAEHGALRWADPLPVPEWVPRVRSLLYAPSVVLADRDKAVLQVALREAAEVLRKRASIASDGMSADYLSGVRDAHDLIRALAEGDTNA
jgi:hypothetical protein